MIISCTQESPEVPKGTSWDCKRSPRPGQVRALARRRNKKAEFPVFKGSRLLQSYFITLRIQFLCTFHSVFSVHKAHIYKKYVQFHSLHKIIVSFQYHREPRQIADLVGQRSSFATSAAPFRPVNPPDRLSCRRIVIPLMVLHQINSSSFSAHLRASRSTSLSHVSR